ncbi:NSFL1 cofactor p47-like [Sycon ciliatum]|uniref:NSFL1 cofactor p47-like n=1 Tax=Sycon ciliatum TaxID=27933 RepID=UPI0031F60206
MSELDHQQDLGEFAQVTGLDLERAQFYLEAANWDVQVALSSYYEDNDEDSSISAIDAGVTPARQSAPPEHPPPGAAASGTDQPKSRSGGAGRSGSNIATMASFQGQESSVDPDQGQEFFAGGSEHSGQVISGPPKKKRVDAAGLAESVMKSAQEHGAETVDNQESKQKDTSSAFTGSGYRLGETPEESQMVVKAEAAAAKESVSVTITFWNNGFSVDDGDRRDGSTEEDKRFLKDISEGVIPGELRRVYNQSEISVTMSRKDSDYVPPKKKTKAFTGSGNRLGSPTPGVIGGAASSTGATSHSAAATAMPAAAATVAASAPIVELDTGKPLTTLQIRLSDGTRLVGKFNTTNTITAIRSFINASRPGMAHQEYYLMTSFPSKELSDESLSLEAANLLNAVVMQRMR